MVIKVQSLHPGLLVDRFVPDDINEETLLLLVIAEAVVSIGYFVSCMSVLWDLYQGTQLVENFFILKNRKQEIKGHHPRLCVIITFLRLYPFTPVQLPWTYFEVTVMLERSDCCISR